MIYLILLISLISLMLLNLILCATNLMEVRGQNVEAGHTKSASSQNVETRMLKHKKRLNQQATYLKLVLVPVFLVP